MPVCTHVKTVRPAEAQPLGRKRDWGQGWRGHSCTVCSWLWFGSYFVYLLPLNKFLRVILDGLTTVLCT